jgi:hypothetical protein
MDVIPGEPFAGALDLRPVLHLERDMMQLRHLVDHEVDRVVIGAAPEEGEIVRAPVGNPEAEHVGVEGHDSVHVADAISDVAELERRDAGGPAVRLGKSVVGKISIPVPLGSSNAIARAIPGEMSLRRSVLMPS